MDPKKKIREGRIQSDIVIKKRKIRNIVKYLQQKRGLKAFVTENIGKKIGKTKRTSTEDGKLTFNNLNYSE